MNYRVHKSNNGYELIDGTKPVAFTTTMSALLGVLKLFSIEPGKLRMIEEPRLWPSKYVEDYER